MKLESVTPIYLESLGLLRFARRLLWAADLIPVDGLKSSLVISEYHCSCRGRRLPPCPARSSDFIDENGNMGMRMAYILGEKALVSRLLAVQVKPIATSTLTYNAKNDATLHPRPQRVQLTQQAQLAQHAQWAQHTQRPSPTSSASRLSTSC